MDSPLRMHRIKSSTALVTLNISCRKVTYLSIISKKKKNIILSLATFFLYSIIAKQNEEIYFELFKLKGI